MFGEAAMFELYHFDNSVCSRKVRLALDEKHLEWQDRRVDILNGAQFEPACLKLQSAGGGADAGA